MRTVKKELLNRIVVVLKLLPENNQRQRALLESFSAQVKRRRRLSEKQTAVLEKIETAVKSGDTSVGDRIVALDTKRVKHPEVLLSVWQADFVSSLRGYVGSLSPSQENTLLKIEALFSNGNVDYQNWAETFKKEKAHIWEAVMAYYSSTIYFRMSVLRTFSGKTAGAAPYIPTKNEYERICEGKYGKRLQAALLDEPKFAKKSLVAVRSNFNPGSILRQNYTSKIKPNNLVFVVDNNTKKVYNACKGGKVYLVLGLGDTKPVEIEERYLKKAPKKQWIRNTSIVVTRNNKKSQLHQKRT
jgi:hypothetical protein